MSAFLAHSHSHLSSFVTLAQKIQFRFTAVVLINEGDASATSSSSSFTICVFFCIAVGISNSFCRPAIRLNRRFCHGTNNFRFAINLILRTSISRFLRVVVLRQDNLSFDRHLRLFAHRPSPTETLSSPPPPLSLSLSLSFDTFTDAIFGFTLL
jgi:hypothetical protein